MEGISSLKTYKKFWRPTSRPDFNLGAIEGRTFFFQKERQKLANGDIKTRFKVWMTGIICMGKKLKKLQPSKFTKWNFCLNFFTVPILMKPYWHTHQTQQSHFGFIQLGYWQIYYSVIGPKRRHKLSHGQIFHTVVEEYKLYEKLRQVEEKYKSSLEPKYKSSPESESRSRGIVGRQARFYAFFLVSIIFKRIWRRRKWSEKLSRIVILYLSSFSLVVNENISISISISISLSISISRDESLRWI